MLWDVLLTFVFNLQFFELRSPKLLVCEIVASKSECWSPQLPKRKVFVSDSDEEFSDFSSGSSDNYTPDEAQASVLLS